MGEETLDPANSKQPDSHEGLYFGREVAAGSEEAKLPLHGPNQWPAEVSEAGRMCSRLNSAFLQSLAADKRLRNAIQHVVGGLGRQAGAASASLDTNNCRTWCPATRPRWRSTLRR